MVKRDLAFYIASNPSSISAFVRSNQIIFSPSIFASSLLTVLSNFVSVIPKTEMLKLISKKLNPSIFWEDAAYVKIPKVRPLVFEHFPCWIISWKLLFWNFDIRRRRDWDKFYRQKCDDEFVDKMQNMQTTFSLLLNTLWYKLVLTQTNIVSKLTSPGRQLILTLYSLTHGVTYTVLDDRFGIPKESRCAFFDKILGHVAIYFCDDYVELPELVRSWKEKLVDSYQIAAS